MAIKSGWKSINEVRKEENMNYIEGMDVLNLGLSAVLYDINTHQYYTPNTDTKTSFEEETITEEGPEVYDLNEEGTKELEKVINEGGEEIGN